MEAIILAGGLGTRLQPVVHELPKCMAPVAGKPFLVYILDKLIDAGLTHAILSVGYKHEAITQYFGNNYRGVAVSYAVEEEPLGTGGGIRLALDQAVEDNVFVLNGDTLFEVDLGQLLEKHLQNSFDITLALREVADVKRYGAVEMNPAGAIQRFLEKGAIEGPGLINGGVYCIRKKSMVELNLPEKFSFEKDILEKTILHLGGITSDVYFIDIGVPEDYEKAEKEFRDK